MLDLLRALRAVSAYISHTTFCPIKPILRDSKSENLGVMFQRLKGAIDSRIAEEQQRQRLSQSSPSRSGSRSGRPPNRTLSPSKRVARTAKGRQDGESPAPAKGPDPAEFEPEFVIDDDEQGRAGTPRSVADQDGGAASEHKARVTTDEEGSQESAETTTLVDETRKSLDLPTDVRVKLRKLEKLESRYHELLRSYKIAHAKVLTIEPFETSLRENTPLTSISDPKAFVEYLNQVTLKGDMVLDELKRVSNERDSLSQRLIDAEQKTKDAWDEVTKLRVGKDVDRRSDGPDEEANSAHSEDKADAQDALDDPLGAGKQTPPTSIKSPTISARGLSLFSPKSRPLDSSKPGQGSEDLFSYDNEVPRLETELKDRQSKINSLEREIRGLKGDLAVTRESTQSMVQTLEEATRELNTLRDSKDRSEAGIQEQRLESEKVSSQLRTHLSAAESKLRDLQNERRFNESSHITELEAQLQAARDELISAQSMAKKDSDATIQASELQETVTKLQAELKTMCDDSGQSEKRIETLNKVVAALRNQLKETDDKNQDLRVVIEKSSKASALLQEKLDSLHEDAKTSGVESSQALSVNHESPKSEGKTEDNHTHEVSNASKKKGKKKRKNNKTSTEHDHDHDAAPGTDNNSGAGANQVAEPDTLLRLREELNQVRSLLDEKDAAIERMQTKLKDQHGLSEEIETLRDDLVNIGQEHVEAKDRIKKLTSEKFALKTKITDLEDELTNAKDLHESNTAGTEQKHKDLTSQFEELKVKAHSLQTDLSAAQQLATSRFKDLNDLRNVLQKAQPEINSLRSEAAEVKSVKEAFSKKEAEFKRLDSRHEEMRSEVARLKQVAVERDSDIKNLNQRLAQESGSRLRAEETSTKMTQEFQRLEGEKRRATESCDWVTKELEKAREELLSCKAKLKDIEQQLSQTKNEHEGLKDEVELKAAQYASAQSLMASMRDQTAEMATQMKEARERCESLDEEVTDAHRLLSERSREGETMRRLLSDVEGRADARTREMKERMDTAIEERDRAEDEASTAGRRRARELEDLRNKYRDMERNLKRAEEDKEELEIAQRDWKRRREELEHQGGRSTREVEEVRRAMGELRDALDGSEKQARELEKQKVELRRSVEETQHRLEKLQKSNKSMADEISKIQTAKTKSMRPSSQSSRSFPDSTPRIGSPAPKSRTGSAVLIDGPNGQTPGAMDFVYLKNVLLQFLEQKDKKHQMQLIPVLGMLLHFDRKDEQKWMSAITTKG